MSWSPPSTLYPATGYSNGYGNATYQGLNGSRHVYGFFGASTYTIEFDTSDNKWYDPNFNNPTHYGRNGSSAPYTSSPETLGTWTTNNDVLTIGNSSTTQNSSLQMAGWPASGSGTGTEGGENGSITYLNNVLTWTIDSSSHTATSYKLFRDTTEVMSAISHTTGSVTTGTVSNPSIGVWTLVYNAVPFASFTVASGIGDFKKVFCNFW